jgi:hypothetical protein
MSRQLHKRLPKEFVEKILEAFNDHRIAEEKACELLWIKRAQLYKLRQRWLQCLIGKKPFTLYSRKESAFHRETIRYFALRHGYYHALPVPKGVKNS